MYLNYIKPALTYTEQLDLLERRGMNILNRDSAESYLRHCNYYRLSGYFYFFYDKDQNNVDGQIKRDYFKSATSFEDIIKIYVMDKYLRTLLLQVIEILEISIRSNFAYIYSHQRDPFIFKDSLYFHADFIDKKTGNKISPFQNLKKKVEEEFSRSKEDFVQHLKGKYSQPYPIWALVETISLGTLSTLFKNLRLATIKNDLAAIYNVKAHSKKSAGAIFETYLQHLTVLRNMCAHHSRLWNKKINTPFTILPEMKAINPGSNKVFNSFILIKHLMQKDFQQDPNLIKLEEFFKEQHAFTEGYGVI
jgi:abortive infection bacteriophage resistance protein